MKEYKCEYYSVQVAENSCFFCQHCTDIFFDYTNGPYMFICDEDADTMKGYDGQCKLFKEVYLETFDMLARHFAEWGAKHKESLQVQESCQENGNKLPRYYGD
jgi:hypothetical protein